MFVKPTVKNKLIINNMKLKSGITVSNYVNTTKKVFHIQTHDDEIVLCNIKDAYTIIKANQCYYLSHFSNFQLINFNELDLVELFEKQIK